MFFPFAGKLVEKTMMQKYGVENVNDHFMSFNTICDATQVKPSSPIQFLKFFLKHIVLFVSGLVKVNVLIITWFPMNGNDDIVLMPIASFGDSQ